MIELYTTPMQVMSGCQSYSFVQNPFVSSSALELRKIQIIVYIMFISQQAKSSCTINWYK